MRPLFFGTAALALLAIVWLTTLSGCSQSNAGKILATGEDTLTVSQGTDQAPEEHKVAPDAKVTLDGQPAQLDDLKPGDSVRVTTEKEGEQEVAVAIVAQRETGEQTAPAQPSAEQPMMPGFAAPISPLEEGTAPPANEESPAPSEREPSGIEESEKNDPPKAEASGPQATEAGQPASPDTEDRADTLLTGEIASLDGDRLRIRVTADPAGMAEEVAIILNDDTKVGIGGEPATLDDLEADQELGYTIVGNHLDQNLVAEGKLAFKGGTASVQTTFRHSGVLFLRISRPKEFYEELKSGKIKGYPRLGNADREQSYYLRMFLSCYQAARYLASLEAWDGKRLVVYGSSQGGAKALATAYLSEKVNSVCDCLELKGFSIP